MQRMYYLLQVNPLLVSLSSDSKKPNAFEYFPAGSNVSLKYFQLESDNHSLIHSFFEPTVTKHCFRYGARFLRTRNEKDRTLALEDAKSLMENTLAKK